MKLYILSTEEDATEMLSIRFEDYGQDTYLDLEGFADDLVLAEWPELDECPMETAYIMYVAYDMENELSRLDERRLESDSSVIWYFYREEK